MLYADPYLCRVMRLCEEFEMQGRENKCQQQRPLWLLWCLETHYFEHHIYTVKHFLRIIFHILLFFLSMRRIATLDYATTLYTYTWQLRLLCNLQISLSTKIKTKDWYCRTIYLTQHITYCIDNARAFASKDNDSPMINSGCPMREVIFLTIRDFVV